MLSLACLFCFAGTVSANTYAAKQLAAFAKSRAGVGVVMSKGPEVYQFLIKAFSGSYTSVPLAWDSREPNDNAYAEHKPTINRRYINIRVSSRLTPMDQVACLVYESINAQNEKEFAELTEQVHEGLLSKTEFIHSILRLEHMSLKRTWAFLSKIQPYKGIKEISNNVFFTKMRGTPEGFDAFLIYLREIKRPEYDVYKHYSDFYDFILPPTKRWKMKQAEKSADLQDSETNTPAEQ